MGEGPQATNLPFWQCWPVSEQEGVCLSWGLGYSNSSEERGQEGMVCGIHKGYGRGRGGEVTGVFF